MSEYVARLGTPDGAVVEQRHRAASADALKRELEGKGLHVFSVRGVRAGLRLSSLGFRERLDSIEFLVFNQQLTTLLKAGIPVLQSLELLQRSQASQLLRDVLARVLDEIRGGVALSDAFANQGGLFPRLYCATIFAGERAGELVPVLERYVKHSQNAKFSLKKPLILFDRCVLSCHMNRTYVRLG